MRKNATVLSTKIGKFDEYNTRRATYANLVLNNKSPEIMINEELRLAIMFHRDTTKGFPCSGLEKPNLIKTLVKVLQSNNGNLTPGPQQPTHMERQVVAEYKAEYI